MLPAELTETVTIGEIDFRERENQGEDGFALGQSVGQFNVTLDDRLSAFTELTAGAKRDEDFEFEVERLIVRYDFSDYAKLSVGRYHTQLGYWNTAFHHGAWLQTTVSRPQAVKFGGNVLPVHFLGAVLEGQIGATGIGYTLGIGNGRGEDIHDPGDLGDFNNSPAGLFALNYRPPGRYRLNAGISGYFEKVRVRSEPDVDEQIYSAHLALESETPEILVEYLFARHESSASKASTHTAYAQLGYRLPYFSQQFKPYVRVEWLDVDDDDPLLGKDGPKDGRTPDYNGVIAGLRWDFSQYAVIKVEGRYEEFDDSNPRTALWIQLAFVFDATSGSRSFIKVDPQTGGAN